VLPLDDGDATNRQTLSDVLRVALWQEGGDVIYVATPRVCDCCYCAACVQWPAVQGRTEVCRAHKGETRDTRAVPVCSEREIAWSGSWDFVDLLIPFGLQKKSSFFLSFFIFSWLSPLILFIFYSLSFFIFP